MNGNDRVALVTGATSGIGKAAAIQLAKLGFMVIVHGRNQEKVQQVCDEIKVLTGNDKIEAMVADLFLLTEVKTMAAGFIKKYNRLDVLINNAGGIMGMERENTKEGLEKTMAVNLFAPFLLTELLLGLLKQSEDGRIINVSSNSHQLNAKPDFDDLQLEKGYTPLRAYGNSKLFLIWVSQHLAARLKGEGISHVTINTLHPGAVKTNFGLQSNLGGFLNFIVKLARPLFKTVEQGADTIVYLATSNDVKNRSGKYFVDRKEAMVAAKYHTAKREQAVFDYCEGVTGRPKQ
jgi:NAD(P)-dependent dehydrogenase (short-subunit alcohol dehydrogenase family)